MSNKLPYSGNAAKKGREFYSSGISRLMNRIDKLEHQVFCCGDDTDEVIIVDGADKVAGENQDGAFFLFDRAAGIEFTLPEATAANIGWNATVNVKTTFSGTMTIKAARTTDLFVGGINLASTTVAKTIAVQPNGTSHDQIIADSDEKGRLAGGSLTFKIVEANKIFVSGNLVGSGTVATPFV
jgi:hypothetical protein